MEEWEHEPKECTWTDEKTGLSIRIMDSTTWTTAMTLISGALASTAQLAAAASEPQEARNG